MLLPLLNEPLLWLGRLLPVLNEPLLLRLGRLSVDGRCMVEVRSLLLLLRGRLKLVLPPLTLKRLLLPLPMLLL